MYALIVKEPFAAYKTGDEITDAATVEQVLAEHHDKVLKVAKSAE